MDYADYFISLQANMAGRCRMYEVWWLMWNIMCNFLPDKKEAIVPFEMTQIDSVEIVSFE